MSRFTIKTKLTVLIIIMLLALAGIIEVVVNHESASVLKQQSFERLVTSRDLKKHQLDLFFKNVVSDIEILSLNNSVVNTATTLDMEGSDQETYNVTRDYIKGLYGFFDNFFNNYVKTKGYYDVYILSLKKGHVMYSQGKKKDLGANLSSGPLKESPLGKLWKKISTTNQTAFVDMAPYAPLDGAPAMFVGTPIKTGDQTLAILAFQINDKEINTITQFRKGYGKTQEDYLVGQDYLMRSDSHLDMKNRSLKASFANPAKGTVKTEASLAALKGQSGQKMAHDYNGRNVLSSYTSVNVGEDVIWGLISEISEDEVMAIPAKLQQYILLVSAGILLVCILLSIATLSFVFVKPLKALEERSKALATGDGDLTQRLNVAGQDEIAIVSMYFNQFIEKVQGTVKAAKESSLENSSIAAELSQTSLQIGKKAENEAQIVSRTTQQGEALQKVLEASTQSALMTKENVIETGNNLGKVKENVHELSKAIYQSSSAENEMAARLQQLSQDADQVKEVLTVIHDIADQTNLLALNAAIEAARAGEHGRGFAVVADEVRQLAERTQRSLTEINATVNVIIQSISDTSGEMSENAKNATHLVTNAEAMEGNIAHSVDQMQQTIVEIEGIIEGYMSNASDTSAIIKEVEAINELSSENARSVEEISAAADHMLQMSSKLSDLLDEYKA